LTEAASWHEQGRRHFAAGRYAEAHACLSHALTSHPDDIALRADLGQALYFGGRPTEAVQIYRDLVERAPENLVYAIDLGRALRATGAYAEAIEVYRAWVARAPEEAILPNNIGNCLLALGQTEAGIASLRRAIKLRPDFIDAHYNLGLALLRAGHMREGWEEYRWRSRLPQHWIDGKPIAEWDGAPMPGKTLFVRPEQGLGDTIQFCRYLPLIAPRARVILGVPRPLHRLLRQLAGIDAVITEGDPTPVYDAECIMMSLPRLLGRYEPADSGPIPYLRADPASVAAWRSRLDPLPGPKIGLVWAGSPGFGNVTLGDRWRSLPLASFAPLRGATFISLQKGSASVQARQPPDGMALIDWTEELSDFADTAALIAALDLVISVDTAVAHLAGALGRPVWMLNRTDTDWRWGDSGETTAWYPTMRIFRQTTQFDWTAPLAALADALHEPPSVAAVLALTDADLATGRSDAAEARLRQTLRDRPDDPRIAAIHAALARVLLLAGRWAEAWPEWSAGHPTPEWPTPRWDGAAMPGETLLLHADTAEDVLLFGRWVAEAVRRSRARVVLSVPKELQRLMAGWTSVAVAATQQTSHHVHCPFDDLPVLFRARPDNIPDTELCPSAPMPLMEFWVGRLARLRGSRVGVAFDDLALLTAIGAIQGINLVALREGSPERSVPVHDWSDKFDDLAAVAGLIVHLDLVIAGDNVIAHLAAALGRPVWLIAPERPRWPWIPGREDNEWYPTVRQFPPRSATAIATAVAALATDTPEDRMFDHGNDCHRRKDYRAAATSFRQTLALNPNHAGALGNLSITMLMLGRPDIALRYAEAGVRAAPGSHPLRMRLGLALHARGRFDDAVAQLREAREMQPSHADTVTALGNALGATGALAEAIATLRDAVALRPDNAGTRTNLAYTLLRAGLWEEGWREHEYRPERPRTGRIWNGQTLPGNPLVLRHEQGAGDIIQFCRFAPLAARRAGSETFLIVPRSLRDLLRCLPGVTILTADDPPPLDAMQFPLLSLPLLFHTTPASIPARAPYLRADPSLWARWRQRVSHLPGLKVGLAWAGNPRLGTASLASTDRRRSLPEAALVPLAGMPGVTFVSLQVGDAPPPGVTTIDWTAALTDFSATAALIASLDLVIAVDTAVAHLAGALGKPVWLLNRFDTDWRWMDGTDDSVWYPTLRQFRQAKPDDWSGVIQRVARALSGFRP
jgi:tetratricopeptide (TPR) repeat protein